MAANPHSESSPGAEAAFVGRARETAAFRGAFDRMLEGRRQILTLAGEPGIGKTRLAEEFGVYAGLRGAQVLTGHCYEEAGAPPYWPWVQILRDFVGALSPSELRRVAGAGASQLLPLVPELGDVLGAGEPGEDAPPEPGHARFKTFDAIGGCLRRASEQVPLVLIIDNAHWADKASLALLEFLSQELVRARLLIVCTYRDTEIARQNPLLPTLAILGGGDSTVRVKLCGLDRAAIAQLAERVLGSALPASVIEEVDRQTDGNPLFVIELLKVLIEESRDAGIEPIAVRIPDGVRETIGRRLSRLPDGVNDLLRVASVVGRSFGAGELTRVGSADIETALEALHLSEGAGFVEAVDSVSQEYRFTHALIRETLYDEIPTPKRLRLHGLVGEALASTGSEHEQSRLSRIAHHFYESAALGNASRAADYAALAGHEAMRLDAYEDALVQYGNVIDLLRQYGDADDERIRQAILLKSGAMTATGRVNDAVRLLAESIETDDRAEDVEWLVDMLTKWIILSSDCAQAEQLPVLHRLIARLPDGDSAARAKLLAAQSFAERTLGRHSSVRALVDESTAMARRIGDPATMIYCLNSAILALRGDPGTIESRIALAAEFLRVAPPGDNAPRKGEASFLQALNLIEAGRIDAVVGLLDEYERLPASKIGLHEYRTEALRVLIALLAGEYTGLSGRIEALREVGQKSRGEDAEGVYGAQMFMLHRDTGRLGAFAPIIERFATSPAHRAWTPGLMLALVEIGRPEPARREFEKLAANGFAAIPHDDMRVTTLVYCAEVCSVLGDVARARELYDLLSAHAGTFACHPTAVCFGSADLFLGMLAATVGDLDSARGHFDAAMRANASGRAWPWLARSCFQYALALGRSGAAEDEAEAERLLREAEQLAGSLGMEGLTAAIGARLRGGDAVTAYPDDLTAREVDVLQLLAIGRSNKDIAKALSISLNTVATHVRNILTKTECANRTEAAAYASRHELVDSR
jgi:DNA-binding CsgD family transcriptional regulator